MPITTLKLGTRTFPTNLIQGPLAGVSCAPFRALTWQYGQPAFSCTEMLSCKTLLHQPKLAQARYLMKAPAEGPVCVQLSGHDPKELSESVKRITDFGADLIDLNCGCPVPKVRNKGAGSSLLTHPSRLFQLIHAMKQNTHLPVSIKIRVDGRSSDRFNEEISKVVHDAGADFLIVHGRHWTEHYETPCHYEDIQFFVETLKIPVIGNGDTACVTTLKKMFSTGCAGVMIGRAGVGQPWLIKQLQAEMTGAHFLTPSLPEIGEIFMTHIQGLSDLLNSEKFAILQARKFSKYYARTMKNKTEFCLAINECKEIVTLKEICRRFFK